MVSTTMVSSVNGEVNAGGGGGGLQQHQQHHDVPYSPPNIMAPEFHPAHMPPDCSYYLPPPESFQYCTPDGYPHPMCQLNTEYGKTTAWVHMHIWWRNIMGINKLPFSDGWAIIVRW